MIGWHNYTFAALSLYQYNSRRQLLQALSSVIATAKGRKEEGGCEHDFISTFDGPHFPTR
jgi:hypothetical protein